MDTKQIEAEHEEFRKLLSTAYDAALGLFRMEDDKSLDKNIYLCNNLVNERPLAQWQSRVPYKALVPGSSPGRPTKIKQCAHSSIG